MEQEINWNSQGLPGKIKLLFGKKQIKKMENKALDISQRIHALSNFTKEAIHQLYGLGEKVTVIPHWCRNDFFRTNSKGEARRILNWPRDVKIIFSVRRLVARMGLDDAIKAAATLLKEHPDTYFAIAGTGPLMRPLKQMVQALGISDKVWFLGRVDDDTLKRFYEAADLYVLPTRSLECFGLIVLEALAFGLPIISTDAGAIPELMKPILPNCIVPAGSVKKLRERIECFFRGSLDIPNNDKLVDYVKKKFSSDTIVPKILDFLATDTT
jgi:glycosyltransferase involved in cell wall biosynthesis